MANQYDLSKYNQMAQMQNIASGLGNISNAQQNYINPLQGMDISRMSVREIEQIMMMLTMEHDRKTMDTPLPSPTKRQLNANPALKNAYDEFMVVWKLTGKETK